MNVTRLAKVPSPSVQTTSTVLDAVRVMKDTGSGAIAVLDGQRLAGIFSERDLALRVVEPGRSPAATLVGDVLTTRVETISKDTTCAEALKLMLNKQIRHLPVVDGSGQVVGLVSIRKLVQDQVEDLVDRLNSVVAYFSADGPGG